MEFGGGTSPSQRTLKNLDWAVEAWYEAIREFTFETLFVELAPLGVDALLQAHNARSTGCPLNAQSADTITALAKAVDEAIANVGGAAFIRISTLSPKDAVIWMHSKLQPILQAELAHVEPDDREGEIIAVNRACCLACRMTNGDDAMDLLVRSDRVDRHLTARKEDVGDAIKINIVVRRWVDFRPELEFRGFVYNRKLTAVTHYYKFCYVREVIERKEAIVLQIQTFFDEHLCETIPATTYVIDFAFLPTEELIVVELNPFALNTSPGLFDWKKDEDVLTGVKPFQLRVLV